MVRLCFPQATRVHVTYTTFLLVLLVSCAVSQQFSFEQDDPTSRLRICKILLNLEFSARVFLQEDTWASLTSRAVDRVTGDCLHHGNIIDLLVNGTVFRFTFVTELFSVDKPVVMFQQIIINAKDAFPNTETEDGYVCFNSSEKTLGSKLESYFCDVPQRVHFQQVKCESPYKPLPDGSHTYSVQFDMKRIKTQAYGVLTGDEFSSQVTCSTGGKDNSVAIIAGCVVGAAVLIALVVVVVVVVLRRRRQCSDI